MRVDGREGVDAGVGGGGVEMGGGGRVSSKVASFKSVLNSLASSKFVKCKCIRAVEF